MEKFSKFANPNRRSRDHYGGQSRAGGHVQARLTIASIRTFANVSRYRKRKDGLSSYQPFLGEDNFTTKKRKKRD
jgi:hypothetical protein